jgi:transposase InsO family protein
VQYASGEYIGRLEEVGAKISMTAAVGNLYENAKAESFFRTLKIKEIYNRKRLHSSVGYVPSVEFDVDYALKVRS